MNSKYFKHIITNIILKLLIAINNQNKLLFFRMGNLSSEIASTCEKATKYFGLTKTSNYLYTNTKTEINAKLVENEDHSIDLLSTTQTDSLSETNKSFKKVEMMTFNQTRKLTDNQIVKRPIVSLNDFTILKLIGSGAFGKVFLVKSKKDNKKYAMKVLLKDKVIRHEQVKNTNTERDLLEKVTHPFLIKLIYAFQDINRLYIVTDFMSGGDLMYNIKKQIRFSEEKARIYACEIFLALNHLHKLDIIYRDLKPENILLDKEGHIKLADFGLSRRLKKELINEVDTPKENLAFSICGTKQYLAPEVYLKIGYSKEIDWWSFGIVLYEMLTGKFISYYVIIEPELFRKKCIEQNLSSSAIDLIMKLLTEDKDKRLTNAEEIKTHSFFKDINWNDIEDKKIQAPYLPNSKNVFNFDACFVKNKAEIIKLKKRGRHQTCDGEIYSLFRGFSFYPQELMGIQ